MIEKLKEKKNIRLAGAAQAVTGSFLLIEHIYFYGIDTIFGHEWLGLILIASGTITGYLSRYGK